MNYLERLNKLINKYEDKSHFNGALNVCKLPFISEKTYLHRLFDKIEWSRQKLEKELGSLIPVDLANFYNYYNGLHLYGKSFEIWGQWRESIMFSPCNLVFENYKNHASIKQKAKIDDRIYFGSTGHHLFFCKNNSMKVFCSLNKEVDIILEWGSFDEFVCDIIDRLEPLYDESGRRKKPNLKYKFPVTQNLTDAIDELEL